MSEKSKVIAATFGGMAIGGGIAALVFWYLSTLAPSKEIEATTGT